MKIITRLAVEWAERAFGHEHVHSDAARAIRMAEETLEFCQSWHVPKAQLHALIDYIYSKEPGRQSTELAQIGLCYAISCGVQLTDPAEATAEVLSYVLTRDPEFFRERNENKNRLGFTGIEPT